MKKVLSIVVSTLLILALLPALALADSTGGSKTYSGPKYSIKAEWTAGGTVNLIDEKGNILPENSKPQAGECFVFEAVADPGYKFVGWSYYQELYQGFYDGWIVYDRVYRAHGEKIDVHINPALAKVNKVTGWLDGKTYYNYASNNISDADVVKLNALDRFWTLDILSDSVKTKYVKAVFAPLASYSVQAVAEGPGSLTTSEPLVFFEGDSVTEDELNAYFGPAAGAATATEAPYFDGWYNADGTAITFPITGNAQVKAVFDAEEIQATLITLSATAGPGGSVSPASKQVAANVEQDLNALFTPVADDGFEFAGWTDSQGTAIAGGIVIPEADMAVIATFKAEEVGPPLEAVTITAIAGPGGTVSPASIQVEKGAGVDLDELFNAVAAEGNSFAGWVDASDAAIVDGIIAAVNSDITVKATFETTVDDDDDPTGDVDDDEDSDNPETGSQSLMWMAFLALGLAGAGAVSMSRMKQLRRMHR